MNKLKQRWHLIEDELTQVEQRLEQIVAVSGPEITEVGNYLFNGSGKRMRPTLFLLAAYDPDHSLSPYVDVAVALELMHTASLLHDDVIDQASTRRGKDTIHVRWSNKVSVLSGDYLLSRAFKMLVGYQDWRLMDVIVDIVQNMTEGEIEQVFADAAMPDLEQRYFNWIGKKSAAFFAGCCRAGSLVRRDNLEEQSNWSEFGYNLGMAFQLVDDLLDYSGVRELTGKPVFSDVNNRVLTLPLIRTINNAGQDSTIQQLLEHDPGSDQHLAEVVRAVLDSDGLDYTYAKAREYIERADGIINEFRAVNDDVKSVLQEITYDVLHRKK